jgi:acyl transferase domain-containing protein
VGEEAVLSTLPHPASAEPASRHLLHTLGRLWVAGVDLDGAALHGTERRRRLPLPTYPFERRRYWIDPPEAVAASPEREAPPEPVAPQVQESSGPHGRPATAPPYVAPRNETELRLAALWSEVLAIDRVGAEDNFFDIGGHSLLAIQLVGRIRDVFAVDLLLGHLSAAPTVAALALWIAERKAEAEVRSLEEVLAMLSDLSDEQAEAELRRRLAAEPEDFTSGAPRSLGESAAGS